MRVDSPHSLQRALELLSDATSETRMLAGGSDLMVELEIGRTQPDRIVDLGRVEELRGIEEENGGVRIGALATCTDMLGDKRLHVLAPSLVEAAHTVGAEQIRNRATLGGNLGTASPAADLVPALMALNATVRLRSSSAQRELPCEEFITGYRQTARRDDELIESIFVPERPTNERQYFRKVGTRRAQAISKVVVALTLCVQDGEVTALSGAAGSVAAHVKSLPRLRDELVGRRLDSATIESAVRASALNDIAPIDDVRSTADYRRQVFARVLRKMLQAE